MSGGRGKKRHHVPPWASEAAESEEEEAAFPSRKKQRPRTEWQREVDADGEDGLSASTASRVDSEEAGWMKPHAARRRRKNTRGQDQTEKVSRFLSWVIKAGHSQLGIEIQDGWVPVPALAAALSEQRRDLGSYTASTLLRFFREVDCAGRYEVVKGWVRRIYREERLGLSAAADSSCALRRGSHEREQSPESPEVEPLVCCSCGTSGGRLWKCSCSCGYCMACGCQCRQMMCKDSACHAVLERRGNSLQRDDGSLIVVCLCCAHAAKPSVDQERSRGGDDAGDLSDDCQIESDAAKDRASENADGRGWNPGDEVADDKISGGEDANDSSPADQGETAYAADEEIESDDEATLMAVSVANRQWAY